ncbi:hypothetical protein KAX02_05420 [candidate division WOR-3 bacterium]|nr:hypothetical protein [candidate division WOR-3 bacterium]
MKRDIYIDTRPYLKSIKLWFEMAKDSQLKIKIKEKRVPRIVCRFVLYIFVLKCWMLARHKILIEGGK